jgi:hypothetical protein
MGDNITTITVMNNVATLLYNGSKETSINSPPSTRTPPLILTEKENRTIQIQMEIAIYLYLMEIHPDEITHLYYSPDQWPTILQPFQKLYRFLYNDFYLFRTQSSQSTDAIEEMSYNTRYIKRVKTFLYPHSFKNRNVSLVVLNGIMNMHKSGSVKEKIYHNIQKTNVPSAFEKLDETYRQYNDQCPISPQSKLTDIEQTIKSLHRMKQDTHFYEKELKKQIHHLEELMHYKQEEIKNNYLREYYKRTLLLNTMQCVDAVNGDIMQYIREYVGETFLEKARQKMIQKRYFKNRSAGQFLRNRLKEFSLIQLKEICRNNLAARYDFSKFMYDEELYRYTDAHFMDTISPTYIGLYSTHILQCTKKEKVINKIMQNVKLVNDFEFQREIILLGKVVNSTKLRET